MTEFRQCTADGKPAWFHKWAEVAFMVPAGTGLGSAPAGQVRAVVGIVEYEDGTMDTVGVKKIKFEDAETAGLRLLSSKPEPQPMGAPFDEPVPKHTEDKTAKDLSGIMLKCVETMTGYTLRGYEQEALCRAVAAYLQGEAHQWLIK